MLNTDIIENYRKKHGLTRSQLALKFGMLPSNYTMMMRPNNRSTGLKTLYRIASVMKISVKKLLED